MNNEPKKDEWFFQQDIKKSIASLEAWRIDPVTILERRESYVEYLAAYAIPIPISRLKITFSDVSWGSEFNHSKSPIVKRRSAHFLSLKFRRMFNPWFSGSCYYDETQSNIIAREEKEISSICKNIKILVSKEVVCDFLKETRQALLWCIRSHRDSERSWNEFGKDFQNQTFKGETYHYVQERIDYEAKPARDRPRMHSGTLLFGKWLMYKPSL